jgi:branched-subunit amino acid aminotransferase/4-amino-4-deoxychorismate lyase
VRAPAPDAPCWVDGQPGTARDAAIAIDDPTCLSGLGLFETMAVEDGRPLELGDHLDRLASGAAAWGIAAPPREDVARASREAAAAPGAGWVKIVLTARGRSIVFSGEAGERRETATAVVLPWRRDARDPLAAHKTLSRAREALGLRWARDRGADEGLWLNGRGHVAEACTANVFLVRGRRLFTPAPREGILPGIVRRRAIEAAKGLRWLVHEGNLRVERFARADEAFLTSSVAGVRSLVALDGVPVGDGRAGRRTAELAAEVARLRRAAP